MSPESGSSNGPSSAQIRESQDAFAGAKAGTVRGPEELPAIDFITFVLSLSHSVLVSFGDAPDPSSGTASKNLPMARQTIDVLALLEQKTQGNLDGEEERVLEQALYDLRMRYIELARTK